MQKDYDWFKILSQSYKDLSYKQLQAKFTIQTHYNEEKFIITCIYINDTMSKFLNMKEVEKVIV